MRLFGMNSSPVCPTKLRLLVRLDPETGRLFWKDRPSVFFSDKATGRGRKTPQAIAASWNARYSGSEAFVRNKDGYRVGEINDRPVKAHRVVWAIVYGYWPDLAIDHINRVRSDNRPKNLRMATTAQNAQNNLSGDRPSVGAYFDKRRGHWFSSIRHEGKNIYLGRFQSEAEATAAHKAAAIKIHGEFHKFHPRRLAMA